MSNFLPISARYVQPQVSQGVAKDTRSSTPLGELLDSFAAAVLDDASNDVGARDRIAEYVKDRETAAAREAEEPLYDRIGAQCVCTCVAHGQIGCDVCNNTVGCPVHSDVRPDAVDIAALADPDLLARVLMATMAERLGLPASVWDSLDSALRTALVESIRRVVSAPFAESVRAEMARLERLK